MELLSTIILFNAFLAVVASFAITFMHIKAWIKFLLIPTIIITTYFCIYSFEDMSGYPYHKVPVGEFELVKHKAIATPDGGIMLQIWAIQKGKSRLFEFPYDPGLDQAMVEAEGKKGRRMLFNIHGTKFGSQQGSQHESGREDFHGGSEFTVRDGSPAMPPKDPAR